MPDASGEVFPIPADAVMTNDNWKHLITGFADGSTRTGLYGQFSVPEDYLDTANLIIVWSAPATAGDVEWDFDYRAVGGNDVESLDQATAQESVNTNDTAPSAIWERMELVIALTDGNFTAEDIVEFFFARDKSDAGDTMAATAYLFDLLFEYADA
jgi:hypothetical protein